MLVDVYFKRKVKRTGQSPLNQLKEDAFAADLVSWSVSEVVETWVVLGLVFLIIIIFTIGHNT